MPMLECLGGPRDGERLPFYNEGCRITVRAHRGAWGDPVEGDARHIYHLDLDASGVEVWRYVGPERTVRGAASD